jgi:hypothetical protein
MPRKTEGHTARRRQAQWVLSAGAAGVVIVLLVVGLVIAHYSTSSESHPTQPSTTAAHATGSAGEQNGTPAGPSGHPSPPAHPRAGRSRASAGSSHGWNIPQENTIATRGMIRFPHEAALPHRLATRTAGPAIHLPKPTRTTGQPVDGGFPATPEGALARLKALDETGLDGLDPTAYKRAYSAVTLPGSPAAETTRLYTGLQTFRRGAHQPTSGPMPQATGAGYTVGEGLIKGTADHGRFVVACVLGTLHLSGPSGSLQVGFGDCQALRRAHGAWMISPTSQPAPAPNTWPGSTESVKAGYRELVGR